MHFYQWCKEYIKASKNSNHGSKQKIVLFKVQLLMPNNGISKREQEEEDACNAAKLSHLKPSGCSITAVLYQECTASSIHQHFTKKISPAIIKYIFMVKQVHICLWKSSMCINLCHSQLIFVLNPRKSSEDDVAYHSCLGCVFKKKYGEEFCFLPC